MLGAQCSNCCPCALPPLPDSIEVEITSGQSEYASVVLGLNPESGPVVYKYATTAVWTIPSGTFVLTPAGPGAYEYSNPSIGVLLYAAFTKEDPQTSRVDLSCDFSVFRSKTLLDTSSPPTQESMLGDSWLDDGCLDVVYPDFSPANNVVYRVRKCTQGSGSTLNLTSRVDLSYLCSANSTTPHPNAVVDFVNSATLVCYGTGCTFPATVQIGHHGVQVPQATGDVVQGTTDLNHHRALPRFLYMSPIAGNFRDPSYVISASGKATATIDAVSLVYGEQKIPMFSGIGNESCSAREGNNLTTFPTLESSLVPLSCS